jgi:hypothetical protein
MASMCLHLDGLLGVVLSEAVLAPLSNLLVALYSLENGSSMFLNSQGLEDSALIDHS